MKSFPLGDQAVLVHLPDETAAFHFAGAIRHRAPAWLVDVVQAYASVAVFYDLNQTRFAAVEECLRALPDRAAGLSRLPDSRQHRIPCCYEFERDGSRIQEYTRLPWNEVVSLHAATEYTVYAIGFCPGFPYLGYLPPALCGVPRLESPRLRVEAGSVGLTGRQTGIYTEARPGGWNIVGRTPLELVNVRDGYFPLRTGDRVQFERIDEADFHGLLGRRL
jgi:inhibitor of KinA